MVPSDGSDPSNFYRMQEYCFSICIGIAISHHVVPNVVEEKEITVSGKDSTRLHTVHFEAPELGIGVMDDNRICEENFQNLLEEFKCADDLGIFDENLPVPCLHEIRESVYAADVSSQCSFELKLDSPDEIDFAMSKSHTCQHSFPLFEVDKIVIGNDISFNLEDQFLILLESFKVQSSGENIDTEINCQDLLSCNETDVLWCTSEHCLLDSSLDLHLASQHILLETNLLNLIEASYTQGNVQLFPLATGSQCAQLPEANGPFENSIMLDIDVFNISEAFSCIQQADKIERLTDMEFKSFEDLIVCHELVVVDDSFKSLPVPVIVDDERAWSLQTLAAYVLSCLDELPGSASDEIYLDWHLLGKDKCNCDLSITCQTAFNDTKPYFVDLTMLFNGNDGQLLGFDSPRDSLSMLPTKEDRLSMMSGGSCTLTEVSVGRPSLLSKSDHLNVEATARSANTETTTAPTVDNHGSQFNDLEFFLNPRKLTAVVGSNSGVKISDANTPFPGDLHMGALQPSTGVSSDVLVHELNLSANLLVLLSNFQKRYLAIFEDYLLLTKTGSSSVVSADTNWLGLTEEKLLECVYGVEHKYPVDPGSSKLMTIAALCAIKRMAWCLSFFGIHAAHVFSVELLQNLEFLRSRLSNLHSMVEDAYRAVDKAMTRLHPVLALIEEMLQNSAKKRKVLIVADLALWLPLKRLLESMNMSVVEVNDSAMNKNLPVDSRTGASVQSDCFLALRENMYASLVKDNFDIILEYGGPYGTSVVSNILPKSSSQLHFIRMKLHGGAEALCQGVGTALSVGFTAKLEELLDFSFIVEKYYSVSEEASGTKNCVYETLPVHGIPRGFKPERPRDASIPETVIIVNTQNFEKEMIISRRSTYQSILAMEKHGVQVVERDLLLPVDVIISASMCLAWYDCINIGKKATPPDEASSSIPLYVDEISANMLTSLSFTFRSCVLVISSHTQYPKKHTSRPCFGILFSSLVPFFLQVFEGDTDFLFTIMESSDVLYAAANSLGIDLQIFFSSSSDLTKEVIISCIGCSKNLTKYLIPKLPESETLAESFLTKFPSINPLMAHVILSTVGLLVELFEWSRECRKHALQKYLVPEETVFLFSALCRYGELEESKSGMTDCSSSVSSAPISENHEGIIQFGRQKQMTAQSPGHGNDLDPRCRGLDGLAHYPAQSRPTNFISPRLLEKRKLADMSLANELFGQELRADACPSTLRDRYATRSLKEPLLMNDMNGSSLPFNSSFSGSRPESGVKASPKLNMHNSGIFQDLDRELMGEVIDIDESYLLGQDFSSFAKSSEYSPSFYETDENQRVKASRVARRLSFDKSNHHGYPPVTVKNNDHVARSSVGDWRQGRIDIDYVDEGNYESVQPLVANSVKRPAENFPRLLREGKGTSPYGATSLSKAIYSAEGQQGSPWTIEFLNRVREKTRLRKQCLPSVSPVPCSEYPGRACKAIRRKSSSILEFLRYQGGSIPRKSMERKRQNQFSRPSTLSKTEKTSASPLRSWTPLDKRARTKLSFAMSGNDGQTRLVWGNENP
ncbi:SHORTAGE IN CHIASMATA 1-like protein [Drosera capensis]